MAPRLFGPCRNGIVACRVSGMAHSFTAKSDGSLDCRTSGTRRRVLVTGAAGNIGSYFAEQKLESTHFVAAEDRSVEVVTLDPQLSGVWNSLDLMHRRGRCAERYTRERSKGRELPVERDVVAERMCSCDDVFGLHAIRPNARVIWCC